MLCKVCKKGTSKLWLKAKKYHIGKCQKCGFAQVLDVPSLNEIYDLYEKLHVMHLKYRSRSAAIQENSCRLKFLRKYIPAGMRILDAGCATGDFLAVTDKDYNVYGSDISSAAIEYTKKRLPHLAQRLKVEKLEDLNYERREFDAICAWDVIEHVVHPITVIRRMMDHLKPRGFLLVSTPDFASVMAKIMRSYWAFMIPPYHLSYFSKRSFEYLFRYRVPGNIISYETRGKTINISFLLYKVHQMKNMLISKKILDAVGNSRFGQFKINIFSNDIAYIAVQKPPVNFPLTVKQ